MKKMLITTIPQPVRNSLLETQLEEVSLLISVDAILIHSTKLCIADYEMCNRRFCSFVNNFGMRALVPGAQTNF